MVKKEKNKTVKWGDNFERKHIWDFFWKNF